MNIILPCKICGTAPKLNSFGSDWYLRCRGNHRFLGEAHKVKSAEEAINKWNKSMEDYIFIPEEIFENINNLSYDKSVIQDKTIQDLKEILKCSEKQIFNKIKTLIETVDGLEKKIEKLENKENKNGI